MSLFRSAASALCNPQARETQTWTSPTGQTYTTEPGSRLLFPSWNIDTGPLPSTPNRPVNAEHRGAMMPVRRRTRAAERQRRIALERAHNDAHIAERNMPPPF